MTYHGHVEKGVVVFDEPVTLPEGSKVRIELVFDSASAAATPPASTMYEHLKSVIGSCPELPSDASVNLDHYLYGHPKQ